MAFYLTKRKSQTFETYDALQALDYPDFVSSLMSSLTTTYIFPPSILTH